MEEFAGILRNEGKKGTKDDALLFLQTLKGINSALNRVDYTQCSLEDCKARLDELLGKIATDLGISNEAEKQSNVPKKYVDFLVFYKLCVIISKIAIAKHDEVVILKGVEKSQSILDTQKELCETTKLRIKNLEDRKKLFAVQDYNFDEVLPPMQSVESQLKMNQMRLRGTLN